MPSTTKKPSPWIARSVTDSVWSSEPCEKTGFTAESFVPRPIWLPPMIPFRDFATTSLNSGRETLYPVVFALAMLSP